MLKVTYIHIRGWVFKTPAILIVKEMINELSVDQYFGLTMTRSPQAAERAEKMKEQHRGEERENLAEVWHTLTSDMMTECAEAAERAVGGGRPPLVLTDRWKGMRPEQLSAIHREQEAQRLERQVLYSL